MRKAAAVVVSVVAAVATGVLGAGAARGQSAAVGELAAGGTARGDISRDVGEEDRIGIDLVQGATLDATFVAGFGAAIELLSPTDATTSAAFAGTATKKLAAWPVPATGRFHFLIRSADGSQGAYTLTASAKFPKRLVLSGLSGSTVTFGLPARASVTGAVAATPAGTWIPTISTFAPAGGQSLLAAPVAGVKGVAKLKKTVAPATGAYEMAVDGGAADAAFTATLTVKAPKAKAARIDLRNGLTPVSFAGDGVAALMRDHGCVGCHSWSASYAGVRSFAGSVAPRIKSGQMPQGRARMSAAEVALFQSWIATGMKP